VTEPEVVVVEVVIAAAAADVWRALRDPGELPRWFGWQHDGLADEIDAIFVSGARASQDDLVIEPEGGDRIRLEDRGETTVVRVTRAAPAEGETWEPIHAEIDAGWLTFLQQLRLALERHRGQDRRTLRLTGRPRPGDAAPTARALGLHDAMAQGPGERYEAVTAVGEPLSGEVWFGTDALTALTVDAYGDGLLVLADESGQTSPPYGRATALLTAYGLDDAAFAALRDRWTGWWEARFDEPGVEPRA
jgi:uncharacterized protein YndB with AHSA1/START domain